VQLKFQEFHLRPVPLCQRGSNRGHEALYLADGIASFGYRSFEICGLFRFEGQFRRMRHVESGLEVRTQQFFVYA
jgi:hypothetical protein